MPDDDTKRVVCSGSESVHGDGGQHFSFMLTLDLTDEEWLLLDEVHDSTGASTHTIVNNALRYALQSSRAMDGRKESVARVVTVWDLL